MLSSAKRPLFFSPATSRAYWWISETAGLRLCPCVTQLTSWAARASAFFLVLVESQTSACDEGWDFVEEGVDFCHSRPC